MVTQSGKNPSVTSGVIGGKSSRGNQTGSQNTADTQTIDHSLNPTYNNTNNTINESRSGTILRVIEYININLFLSICYANFNRKFKKSKRFKFR